MGRGLRIGARSIQLSGSDWTPNRVGGLVASTDWAQLPANTFVKVVGTANELRDIQPSPAYLDSGGSDGFDGVVNAWCDMAWDSNNQVGYISGGGHGNSSGAENGIFEVALNKLQFAVTVGRSAQADVLKWNGSALIAGEGFPSGGNYPNADGRPGSMHTYNGLPYISPATMATLGFTGNVKGGVFYPGNAKCVISLDNGAQTKVWWKRSDFDQSYITAMVDGTLVFGPRASFTWWRFDLTQTETTDWQAEAWDSTPATPSVGKYLTNATSGTQFVYNNKLFCWLPERRECVSFAGNQAAQRLRYGQAIDAATTTWTSYQDAITLTGTDAADFSSTNLLDTGTNELCGGGAHYDHTNACIWACGNKVGSSVYKITGLSTNTWTVTKVASGAVLTQSSQGTFGRFRVGRIGGVDVGIRISSVDAPIEIIRLEH